MSEREHDTERELRRMRECEEYIRSFHWNPETPEEVRDLVIGNVRAAWNRGGEARESEMTHRDRTAEREAASKALDACSAMTMGYTNLDARDLYLAREFDAGERVMLPDGSVVWRDPLFAIWCRTFPAPDFPSRQCTDWRQLLNQPTDTGAYFDAVKRLAEQRGAER